jgi:cysteine desulfurase / selenocysteine lyase
MTTPSSPSAPWTYKSFVADALKRVKEDTCEEIAERLKTRDRPILLDVREGDETDGGYLPGSVMLPRGLLEKHVHEHIPDKDATVVVYCSTGNRSALAADVLHRMGYTRVTNLKGGIERWRHLGLRVEGHPTRLSMLASAKLDWDMVRAEFAIVARHVPVLGSGERPLVYLDHAASTHAPESVLKAYQEFHEREYANVHRGTHLLARKATERFQEAYGIAARFIGGELDRGCVCFTSNTTSALDLASHVMADRPGKVITTEMEHHSNELVHRRRGPVLRARIGKDGLVDLDHLEELLRKNEVKLVAVTAAANVTGLMPNLSAIARMAHERGALVLADAAQILAHHRLDVKPIDHPEHLDFVAAAGHKAYAPFGAGFLYGPRALMSAAPPYLPGGGTASNVTANDVEYLAAPDRHQGGTPNIAGVVGLSRALLFIQAIGLDAVREHELDLLRRAVDGLRSLGGVTIYGDATPEKRLGVVSFNVDGVSDLMTAAILSEEGALAVRNGRFCAHIYMDRLLELHHRGEGEIPTGAVRASFGMYNTPGDVDRLLEFVRRVRDRRWVGHYRVSGDDVSAEFAGRCADRWMEAAAQHDAAVIEPSAAVGYVFEVLQPDSSCRSYLIADPEAKLAAIVDPIRERVDDYLTTLTEKGWKLVHTIETHTHADHLSGSARLKELTGCTMLMSARSTVSCIDRRLEDGDVVSIGSLEMKVIATPGHTSDSICLALPGRVLTGDTLLIDGCGRTDLPTGDARVLHKSLKRLMELPDDLLVFPAHDYHGLRASTIGRERKSNKRVAIESADGLAAEMAAIRLAPPLRLREVLQANLQCL